MEPESVSRDSNHVTATLSSAGPGQPWCNTSIPYTYMTAATLLSVCIHVSSLQDLCVFEISKEYAPALIVQYLSSVGPSDFVREYKVLEIHGL